MKELLLNKLENNQTEFHDLKERLKYFIKECPDFVGKFLEYQETIEAIKELQEFVNLMTYTKMITLRRFPGRMSK